MPAAKDIANANKNYFIKSFASQAWAGKGWKEVQRRIAGTPAYKYPKKKDRGRRTRAILVKTGALRRSVNNSIESVTTKAIKFKVRLPYAEIHNEGGRMANGGKMPKRQYMGWNREVDKITKATIQKWVDKAWGR